MAMVSTVGDSQHGTPVGGEPWFVAVEVPVRARAARPELGAGERLDAPGVAQLERARSRGLRTAVLARDLALYADDLDWAADRWIECDTLHPEPIVAAVGGLDGTVAALTSSVDDVVGPAAAAARALGLRGPTPGSPALAHDEGVLRAALAAAGIAVAPWVVVSADDPDLESAVGYPCVVAPVDGGRALGVGLVSDRGELRALAARHAVRPTCGRGVRPRRILLEQYVDGPRYCADGVVTAGEPVILSWSDQMMGLAPGFTEMALTATRQAPTPGAAGFVAAVLDAAGYDFGPFHLEFVLGPTGPLVTALHPRPAGAGAQRCVDLVSGRDTADLAVALLLGEAPTGAGPSPVTASTRMCVMAHAVGRVRSVAGLRDVAHIPGLVVAEVFTDVGGETGPSHAGGHLGHVVTVGCTPEQARRRAAYALDGIRVDVEELQTV